MNDKADGVKPPKQTANPSRKLKLEAVPAQNPLERKHPFPLAKPRLSRY